MGIIDCRNVVYSMKNYVNYLGLILGLRSLTLIEYRLGHRTTCFKTFHVPGIPFPIHLLAKPGDHAIFWKCIVDRPILAVSHNLNA